MAACVVEAKCQQRGRKCHNSTAHRVRWGAGLCRIGRSKGWWWWRVMGMPTADIFAFCGKPLLACTFCIHGALFMRGPFCVHAVCTLCVLINTNRWYPRGAVTRISRYRFSCAVQSAIDVLPGCDSGCLLLTLPFSPVPESTLDYQTLFRIVKFSVMNGMFQLLSLLLSLPSSLVASLYSIDLQGILGEWLSSYRSQRAP